jgi:hypothetical protein
VLPAARSSAFTLLVTIFFIGIVLLMLLRFFCCTLCCKILAAPCAVPPLHLLVREHATGMDQEIDLRHICTNALGGGPTSMCVSAGG